MSNRQQRIKALFNSIVELESVEEQASYLDEHCPGDERLRAEVLGLVSHERQMGPFLENSTEKVLETMGMPGTEDFTTPQIGPYKIREQLGEGGMGVVYVAEQTEPVRRKVALKIIKPGMDSKEVIARFEAERQALAMMSHPHIAKVLDGGTTEQGRPYFVMELVKGISITKFCDDRKLPLRERLELFVTVCEAVQHAHLKGVIHRDLKPSNVLVELHDVKGVPKVIDFGIAKAINQQLTQQTIYTQFSQLVGTPLYMSPEQAELSGLDVDTRSDVYSLGVLLYELLTGVTPFDESTLSSVGLDEMRRIIREDEPDRPSQKVSTLEQELVSTISLKRQIAPRQLSLSMQRELDWIVMKTMEKDRTRRYESASDLAEDIQRYLEDDPVQAHPPSVGYRLRKFAKRHTGVLATSVSLVLMLVVSTIVSAGFAIQAEEEKEKAITAEQKAANQLNVTKRERDRANRNFENALETMDQLLAHVANPELNDLPHAQPIVREMLKDVLQYYEQFSRQNGSSAELRFRAAKAWHALASISRDLGDREKSLNMRTKALSISSELHDKFPENPEYCRQEATEHLLIGLHNQVGKPGPSEFMNAEKHFQRSAELFEKLVEELPVQASDQADLGHAMIGLAKLRLNSGHRDKAAELINRASKLIEASGDLKRLRLALVHQARLIEDVDPAEADRLYSRVVTVVRKRSVEEKTRDARLKLAFTLGDEASRIRMQEPSKAEQLYREAITVGDELVNDYPDIPRHAQYNRWLFYSLTRLLLEQKRDNEARELFVDFRTTMPRDQNLIIDLRARALIEAANHSEADGDFERALAYCNETVQITHESTESLLARAKIFIEFDKKTDALADLMLVCTRKEADSYPLYPAALLSLHQGESLVYENFCKQMLAAPFATLDNDNSNEIHFVAWTCALAPDAVDDYEPAIKLARRAVKANTEDQQYRNGLGAILMRAEKYGEARDNLTTALSLPESGKTSTAYIRYFLAMTEHHLGNKQAAQTQLAAANESAEKELSGDPAWNRRMTLELLRKEAEALIGEPAENNNSSSNWPPPPPLPRND